MRVVRALFWIVTVSLLLAGGNGISARYQEGPGARYVNEDSPAYHSAQRVVASVRQLNGWCDGGNEVREGLCSTAATTGHVALEGIDRIMLTIVSLDIFAGPGDPGQLALKVPGQTAQTTTEPVLSDVPATLMDDLKNLLYSDGEELEDIG